ncbi:MAG: flagellar hook-length control protein FliK [Tissierellaceae bacterium]|nr:flagellar hook-length control protein FliK [Tissierellaceae bacterium]
MEIKSLQITNGQNIPGLTKVKEIGDVFSQILAQTTGNQLKGLLNLEGESISDLVNISDLAESLDHTQTPDDEEEEDLLFNPMNTLWNLTQSESLEQDISSIIDKVDLELGIENANTISVENMDSIENIVQNQDLASEVKSDMVKDLLVEVDSESMENKHPVINKEDRYFDTFKTSFKSNLNNEKYNVNLEDIQLNEESNKDISMEANSKLMSTYLKSEDVTSKDSRETIDLSNVDLQNNTLRRVDTSSFRPELTTSSDIDFNDNIQKVNDAFIELMDLNVNGEDKSMKVKLYPEELGHIDVTLKMEEGKLVAKIVVENEQVRELFNTHINQLSDKLIRQDIHLERLDVDLNFNTNSQSGSRNHQNTNKNPFKKYVEILGLNNSSISSIIYNEEYIYGTNRLNILA